jgi:hypothetical protein
MHSYEVVLRIISDNAQLKKKDSYARPFRRKQGVIETIDNLGKFDKDFRNFG